MITDIGVESLTQDHWLRLHRLGFLDSLAQNFPWIQGRQQCPSKEKTWTHRQYGPNANDSTQLRLFWISHEQPSTKPNIKDSLTCSKSNPESVKISSTPLSIRSPGIKFESILFVLGGPFQKSFLPPQSNRTNVFVALFSMRKQSVLKFIISWPGIKGRTKDDDSQTMSVVVSIACTRTVTVECGRLSSGAGIAGISLVSLSMCSRCETEGWNDASCLDFSRWVSMSWSREVCIGIEEDILCWHETRCIRFGICDSWKSTRLQLLQRSRVNGPSLCLISYKKHTQKHKRLTWVGEMGFYLQEVSTYG